MRAAAIICEYNPFHNGHARQFALTRGVLGADTAIVCLMSGCFVQRGEPAIFEPMVRARAALLAGADLVLENPVTNVLRSAEGYAAGSVEMLQKLGVIDYLSFGCEQGRTEELLTLAKLLDTPEFSAALRPFLDAGLSFPAARQRAVETLGGNGALLEQPNCILAIEYCKALLKEQTKIQPLPVLRTGNYHARELNLEAPSATALRKLIAAGEDWCSAVPEQAASAMQRAEQHSWTFGERAVLSRLRTLPREQFCLYPHGSEGLWSRFYKATRAETSISGILEATKSKRYAYTRISRLLCCAYLDLQQKLLDQSAPYLRVLGFRARGQELLHRIKKDGNIQLLHAGDLAPNSDYAELEERATDLYALCGQKPEYGLLRRARCIRMENQHVSKIDSKKDLQNEDHCAIIP